MGINSGVIVGGLVGTDDRLGYTVHGDEVNLAARLEQLNKEYGTHVIVSEHTRQLAGEERFAFQRMGEVTVRGRKNRWRSTRSKRNAHSLKLNGASMRKKPRQLTEDEHQQ